MYRMNPLLPLANLCSLSRNVNHAVSEMHLALEDNSHGIPSPLDRFRISAVGSCSIYCEWEAHFSCRAKYAPPLRLAHASDGISDTEPSAKYPQGRICRFVLSLDAMSDPLVESYSLGIHSCVKVGIEYSEDVL